MSESLPFKFEMGQKVKDRITGFTGIIVGRSQYMTGCNRYALLSQKLHDGKPADWVYIDEDLLEVTGFNIKTKLTQRGGPVQKELPQR